MKDLLLGTWNYKVAEAPFGFRTGKAIFFEENGELKAKLKIYGLTINTKDLIVDGTRVSFNAEVDIEQVAIRLELEGDELKGLVQMSEGTMAVVMEKKGVQKSRRQKAETATAEAHESTNLSELAQRRKPVKELCQQINLRDKVHTFYYGWYGNPEFDGEYIGWNHQVQPHWIENTWNDVPPHTGGDDVASNFYPQLGCYSTSDPEVIQTHMQQIYDAGIGVE